MTDNETVPRRLLRGYVTVMFIVIMVAFAITMTIVLRYGHRDSQRAVKLAAAVAATNVSANYRIAQSSYINCLNIEKIKTSIRLASTRESKSLLTISYYKTHPAELAAAKLSLSQQVQDFAPAKCPLPTKIVVHLPK